jgi:2-polyprenyl-6-hydroxyphenyl methylase/3-demethylubiquinone-9 3-methyltransferase
MPSSAPEQSPPVDGRFEFGKNWQRFVSVLSEDRIAEAERSLAEMLGRDALAGASFLDAGSGSGLFSLAALHLGAARVHSFDYDPDSVAASAGLRDARASGDERWTVERGSVLDDSYLDGLGTWDVVYSWGVLHHTGDMWRAMANVDRLVAEGGLLYIALYNDQGLRSRVWARIKRTYNALPGPARLPFLLAVAIPRELLQLTRATLLLHPHHYVRSWTEYKRSRGMSRWHDIVDWIGGYPFEVAGPDAVFDFYRERGYELTALRTIGAGSGCNQYVFRKASAPR